MKKLLCVLFIVSLFCGMLGGCIVNVPAESSSQMQSSLGDSSKDETQSDPDPLYRSITDAEKQEIHNYLNDDANLGFVSIGHYYTSPEKVNLFEVFYSGAGVGTMIEDSLDEWSEEERQAVSEVYRVDVFYTPVFKVTASAVEQVVQEKLGISVDENESYITDGFGFYYVEAYDAHYHTHSDSNLNPVTITGGKTDGSGLYMIEYTHEAYINKKIIVTLRKTDTGYQFVSNVKAE